MKGFLNKSGTYAGYVGAIICILAVAGRFYGGPELFGFNATAILINGIGLGVFACWAKLEAGSTKEAEE